MHLRNYIDVNEYFSFFDVRTVKTNNIALKVFVSGPMTGYGDFNFRKFDLISGILKRAGVTAVNPADICRKYGKDKVLANRSLFTKMVKEEQAAEKRCSAILLLDGWEMSSGARLELTTALKNGLDVFLEKDIGIITGMAQNPETRLAVTVDTVRDEDIKAKTEGKYGNIPAGSRVLILGEKDGFLRVLWNGNVYLARSEAVYILK